MKFFVVALSLFVVAAAAPTSPNAADEAQQRPLAMEHEEIHDKLGQFALRYVSPEGSEVSKRGRLVPAPNGTYSMVFATSSKHTSPITKKSLLPNQLK